jgi:menaquinol-cytochrome c reductase iron-sulfur subunit
LTEPELTEPSSAPQRRRRFLVLASAVAGALSAIAASAPSLFALLSPVLRKPAAKGWTKVVDDVNTVDVGVPFKVDFSEAVDDAWIATRSLRSVWLYTEDATSFRAFSGVCTHLGCSIGFDSEKKRFHCPCHHGLFDAQSGAVIGGPPPRGMDALPVKVENGEVHIRYLTFQTGIDATVET